MLTYAAGDSSAHVMDTTTAAVHHRHQQPPTSAAAAAAASAAEAPGWQCELCRRPHSPPHLPSELGPEMLCAQCSAVAARSRQLRSRKRRRQQGELAHQRPLLLAPFAAGASSGSSPGAAKRALNVRFSPRLQQRVREKYSLSTCVIAKTQVESIIRRYTWQQPAPEAGAIAATTPQPPPWCPGKYL